MKGMLGKIQLRQGLDERWYKMYRVAYSWCHDPQLSKDLVQETFVKALKNSNQLRDNQLLDVWLFRIMKNCWHDQFRKQKNIVDLDQTQLVDNMSPEIIHEREIMIINVRKAVQKLKWEHREVVTLVDLEKMSYKDVADILDIPIGTVMSRLCRARNQLKETMQNIPDDAQNSNIRRIK